MEVVTAELAGGDPMLDRVVVGPDFVVLLDGASAFTQLSASPVEYVDLLATGLAAALAAAPPGADLRTALGKALRRMPAPSQTGDEPSSTVSIVRWSSHLIDVLVLGDSPVFLDLRDRGVVAVQDRRLAAIALQERDEYQARLRAGTGFDDAHRALVRRSQVRQFRHRNRPGGYWIAASDPTAAQEAVVERFAAGDVQSVLLLSDGVSDGIGLPPVPRVEVLMHMDSEQLIACLHELAGWERSVDPTGTIRPRSKVSDDKSAVLLRPGRARPDGLRAPSPAPP